MSNAELIDELCARAKALSQEDRSLVVELLPYLLHEDAEECEAARHGIIQALDRDDLEFCDIIGCNQKIKKAARRFNTRYVEYQKRLAESENSDCHGPA